MDRGPRRAAVGVAALALLSAVVSRPVQAVTLCEKKSGRVVAVDSCGKRDTALSPADIGLVGIPGATGATGAPGPDGQVPLRIVDAGGRDVCHVIGAGAAPQCVLDHPALTRPVLLTFETLPLEIGTVGSSTAYYLEADCAGQPYVRNGRPLLPPASLIGRALFYATGEDATVAPLSFEDVPESCTGTTTPRGTCCQPYTSMSGRFVAPAVRLDVSELGLALPFSASEP
jgi:hypothetical protein